MASNEFALAAPPSTTLVAPYPQFQEYYSVQWAGAKSDGSTDDTAAVTRACNFCRANNKTLWFPPGITYTGTFDRTGISVICGDPTAQVRIKPGQDGAYWKAPDEAGYIQPTNQATILYGAIDDTVDVSSSFNRYGPGGEHIGNAFVVFPNPNNIQGITIGPTEMFFDIYCVGLTNTDNNQCALLSQSGIILYRATFGGHYGLLVQNTSFGWIDGIAGARAATFNSSTDVVTQTAHGYTNGKQVAILSDGGVIDVTGAYKLAGTYTTLPGGLTPRSIYFVINQTTNTYQVSLTMGGSAIDITSNGANCAVAPAGTDFVGGGDADEMVFSSIRITADKVCLSLIGHNFCNFGGVTVHAGHVAFRLYLYPSYVGNSANANKFSVLYTEGPTVGDTSMTNQEYFRDEWTNTESYGVQISPSTSQPLFATFAGNDSIHKLTGLSGPNTIVNVLGDRADIYVGTAGDHQRVIDYGNSNFIIYANNTSGEFVSHPPNVIAGRVALSPPGGINSDWVATNPSSFYKNKNSLFIPAVNTYPLGLAANLWGNDFTDTTTRYPGSLFLVNTTALFESWTGTNSETILVSDLVPASKGTLYAFAKATTTCTATLAVAGPVTTATTTMSLTTTYSMWSCRYDATTTTPLSQIGISIGAPNTTATVSFNWFCFVPDNEIFHTNELFYGDIPQYYGSAAPSTGAHVAGEIVWNSAPTSSGFIGFVCVTAGTPGTWKTFGVIS